MTLSYIGQRAGQLTLLGLLSWLGVVATGCSSANTAPPLRPGTEQEAERLGQQLLAGLKAGDGEAVLALWDIGVLVELGGGSKLDDEERREVAVAFRQSFQGPLGFVGHLITTVENGGTVRLFPVGGRCTTRALARSGSPCGWCPQTAASTT